MTLLGNFEEMSGQEQHHPFIENKRSERSMRGENPHPHQAGNGSHTASSTVHVVHTPPREDLFSLSTCPDKISQQSHKSAPTDGWIISLKCIRSLIFLHESPRKFVRMS